MESILELLALPSPGELISAVVRLVVASALGGVLGLERESVGKPAGVRTHMMVALGAALLMLLIVQDGTPSDASRVMQGIAAGVGFIGAGTILKQRDTGDIVGLTTAASVWLTAAVGVGAGIGRLYLSIIATVCGLLILKAFAKPDDAPRP
jgi:putative Mg2+ transporter-C (MgtC) family protein